MTIAKPRLIPGSGKVNAMLAVWGKLPKFLRNGVVYVSNRREVENLDASRFMAAFGPQAGKQELLRLRGNVHFTVEGYDDCDDELYEIPQVRAFYGHLHTIHPCWIYMARAECPCLNAVALSVVPNITVCRSARSLRVFVRTRELIDFILQSIETVDHLDRRAGIRREASEKLFIRAARYFDRK